MRIRSGLLFWGLFFILLGGLPLLVRAGALDPNAFSEAWRLWPLLLVAFGVALIFGRSRAGILATVVAAVALGIARRRDPRVRHDVDRQRRWLRGSRLGHEPTVRGRRHLLPADQRHVRPRLRLDRPVRRARRRVAHPGGLPGPAADARAERPGDRPALTRWVRPPAPGVDRDAPRRPRASRSRSPRTRAVARSGSPAPSWPSSSSTSTQVTVASTPPARASSSSTSRPMPAAPDSWSTATRPDRSRRTPARSSCASPPTRR